MFNKAIINEFFHYKMEANCGFFYLTTTYLETKKMVFTLIPQIILLN
jgi:hypothetical protein